MSKSRTLTDPIICTKKDYTKNQFDLICKLFGIDPENTNSFVLREKAEIEVDYN